MEEKEKVPSDSNGLSGEGNIENILLVEKGLRELASLKVFVHNLMLEILFIDIICLLLEIFIMEECMCKSVVLLDEGYRKICPDIGWLSFIYCFFISYFSSSLDTLEELKFEFVLCNVCQTPGHFILIFLKLCNSSLFSKKIIALSNQYLHAAT